MTQTSRITADELAQDILVRQGHAFMNEYSTDVLVQAHLTEKQSAYLLRLARQDGLHVSTTRPWSRPLAGSDLPRRQTPRASEVIESDNGHWSLHAGNRLLSAHLPSDWHPLDYQEYTYRPPS